MLRRSAVLCAYACACMILLAGCGTAAPQVTVQREPGAAPASPRTTTVALAPTPVASADEAISEWRAWSDRVAWDRATATTTTTIPTGPDTVGDHVAPVGSPDANDATTGNGWVYDPAVDAMCWGGPCYRYSTPCVIPPDICEGESQGYVNIHTRLDSTASGKYQVLVGTWGHWGGYSEAGMAPESVQDDFARHLWDDGRGCGHWRC